MRSSSIATKAREASWRPSIILIISVVLAFTVIYLSIPRISYKESFGIQEKSDSTRPKSPMTTSYQSLADQLSRTKNDKKGDSSHWYLEDDED